MQTLATFILPVLRRPRGELVVLLGSLHVIDLPLLLLLFSLLIKLLMCGFLYSHLIQIFVSVKLLQIQLEIKFMRLGELSRSL
jgi:hypothetical protein